MQAKQTPSAFGAPPDVKMVVPARAQMLEARVSLVHNLGR
jgi:hypothetical protein